MTLQVLSSPGTHSLDGRQKAAIVVRFLLGEGADLPISDLPDDLQARLATQIGRMRLVDRDTLRQVLTEFSLLLDGVGLAFPADLDGALALLDGRISPDARLRLTGSPAPAPDPWQRLAALDAPAMQEVLDHESIEVAAVALSRLPVSKAAEILSITGGSRARSIALAMARTGQTRPETVAAIGAALAAQLDVQPTRAFSVPPEERIGAILNAATPATRDDVLRGLEVDDATLALRVRKAIFTFADLPARLEGRDVAKVVRGIAQARLAVALAGSVGDHPAVVEFLLANLSQRMANALREEMGERPAPKAKDVEAAQGEVVAAVRMLVDSGEITLIETEEEEH